MVRSLKAHLQLRVMRRRLHYICSSHVACAGAVRCLLRMYRRARLHKIEDHVMSVLDDADAQVCSITSRWHHPIWRTLHAFIDAYLR